MAADFLRVASVGFVAVEEDDFVVCDSWELRREYAGHFSFLRKGESRFPFLNDYLFPEV